MTQRASAIDCGANARSKAWHPGCISPSPESDHSAQQKDEGQASNQYEVSRAMAIVTLGVLLSVKWEAEKMVNALETIFRIYKQPVSEA